MCVSGPVGGTQGKPTEFPAGHCEGAGQRLDLIKFTLQAVTVRVCSGRHRAALE